MFRERRTQDEMIAAFWARVDRSSGRDACWPWIGCIANTGYGALTWRNPDGALVNRSSHSLAWELTTGDAPKKRSRILLRHSCHNRPCCNPAHLSEGTDQDNADDSAKAGRVPTGDERWNAVLSPEEAMAIQASPETGVALAQRLGISNATVSQVRNNKHWATR